MKDFVIKGNGNSRYLKSSLEGITTWEQFRAALAAGTLPIDLNGINPEGFQQLGDPLNKATLLKDATAALLGLGTDAVPDDAFVALVLGQGVYGYRVKVQLSDGTPVQGSTVSGISPLQGGSLVTGADGTVLGKSTSASVTIGCSSPYIDQKAPGGQGVTASGTITDVTLTLMNNTDTITWGSSRTISNISPFAKTVDLTSVGGGGGGTGSPDHNNHGPYAGNGGGGGYVQTKLSQPINGKTITITIGAGGNGSKGGVNKVENGGNGGQTTVKVDEQTVLTAAGGGGATGGSETPDNPGSGGRGNGNGGTAESVGGTRPTNGVGYLFDDSSLGIAGGGGGGYGAWDKFTDLNDIRGGDPYGGSGGRIPAGVDPPYNGNSGSRGGGGGGAGRRLGHGGQGGSGVVYLRFHF